MKKTVSKKSAKKVVIVDDSDEDKQKPQSGGKPKKKSVKEENKEDQDKKTETDKIPVGADEDEFDDSLDDENLDDDLEEGDGDQQDDEEPDEPDEEIADDADDKGKDKDEDVEIDNVDEPDTKGTCLYNYVENKSDDEEDDDIVFDDDNMEQKAEVIPQDKRTTKPILYKYERVRLLGDRSQQLTLGAKPMIKNVEGLTPKEIAELEIKESVIPLIIQRPLPNGKKERWYIHELKH